MTAISGNTDLPHNQNTLLYNAPEGKCATVTVNLCNRTDEVRNVGILIVKDTHTFADFIEYQTPIPPKGVLERTGIVLTEGEWLLAVCNNNTGVSARFHGFEEDV